MKTAEENLINGRKTAEEISFSRTDVRYWSRKVRKEKKAGWEGKDFVVRIEFRGKRVQFDLNTANREEAARKAQRLYLSIVTSGWDPVLATEKPTAEPKGKPAATVGSYLEAVEKVATLEPRTLNEYRKALRRVVSGIQDIDGRGRYDWRRGQTQAWRDKIDRVKIATITHGKIQAWRVSHLQIVGDDPTKVRAMKNTINSVIRNAKALFGEKVLPHVREVLEVPNPHPFAKVEMYSRQSSRYLSKIQAGQVVERALEDLLDPEKPDAAKGREQFKILVLAVFAGLRFNEIDKLLWKQIDLDRSILRIEATPYFHPKTEESAGEVDLDSTVVQLLRSWKCDAKGEFVVHSPLGAKTRVAWNAYRCEQHHNSLLKWLRNLEFNGERPLARVQKPLHELRKEAGSLVNQLHGLYAAQRFMRHSDIRTTAAHYLDKKQRITPGLGSLLESKVFQE